VDLSIIIVNFNTRHLLADCLESIFKQNLNFKFRVVVVDNGSSDGSAEMVENKFPDVKVVKSDKNLGFSKGNNLGIKAGEAKYYLLLNSDTIVPDKALKALVDFMEGSEFSVGSCKLLNKDGSFQPNAGDLPFGLPLFFWLSGWDDILPKVKETLPSFHRKFKSFYNGEKEVGWVSGSIMIIKDEVYKKIGGLDEKIFMYCEDTDYCIRAKKAGFKVGWTDKAEIVHLGGGSSKNPNLVQWIGEFKGLEYLYKKHLGLLPSLVLSFFIKLFIIVRAVAFILTGKFSVSKTYAKLLFNI